jgi:hypothetical protein
VSRSTRTRPSAAAVRCLCRTLRAREAVAYAARPCMTAAVPCLKRADRLRARLYVVAVLACASPCRAARRRRPGEGPHAPGHRLGSARGSRRPAPGTAGRRPGPCPVCGLVAARALVRGARRLAPACGAGDPPHDLSSGRRDRHRGTGAMPCFGSTGARCGRAVRPGSWGDAAPPWPQDNLDGARGLRQPKGHERRRPGPRHAGVRLVQEGPTVRWVLAAPLAPPGPCQAED